MLGWAPQCQTRWARWRALGAPRRVQAWIRHGIRPRWTSAPTSPPPARIRERTPPEMAAMDDLVHTMTNAGIVQLQPPGADSSRVLPAWAEPKMEDGQPNGKFRFILDCRHLNNFCDPQPVKSEGLSDLPHLTQPGDEGAVQDMVSCYFQFPLHPDEWHLFAFEHRDRIYHMTRLPMGFRLSQMYVVKCTRWIIQRLRSTGHRLLQYTDDFAHFAAPPDLPRRVQDFHDLFEDLGLPISPTKGFREGRTRFVLLGLGIDLAQRKYFTPDYKRRQLHSRVRMVLAYAHRHRRYVPRRMLARAIGTAGALALAIPMVGLWLASLHTALDLPPGIPLARAWNGSCQLPNQAMADLQSLLEIPPEHQEATFDPPTPTASATSDASTTGFGAHSQGLPDVSGFWNLRFTHRDIGRLEMRAVTLAMRAWRQSMTNHTVLWWTDNTSVIRALNHHACRSAGVMEEYRALAQDLIEFGITMQGRHISGITNVRADALSRRRDPHEYTVNLRPLLPAHWPTPTHDRFASAQCHQPDIPYDSRYADPEATTIDTFNAVWEGTNWVTPPFNLMSRVIDKIIHDRATAILVVPIWAAQPWWARLCSIAIDTKVIDLPATDWTHPIPNNDAKPEPTRHPWAFQLAWVDGSTSRP